MPQPKFTTGFITTIVSECKRYVIRQTMKYTYLVYVAESAKPFATIQVTMSGRRFTGRHNQLGFTFGSSDVTDVRVFAKQMVVEFVNILDAYRKELSECL